MQEDKKLIKLYVKRAELLVLCWAEDGVGVLKDYLGINSWKTRLTGLLLDYSVLPTAAKIHCSRKMGQMMEYFSGTKDCLDLSLLNQLGFSVKGGRRTNLEEGRSSLWS